MRSVKLILTLLALALPTYAESKSKLTCSENGTLVIYTNGVDNTRFEAEKAAFRLDRLLSPFEIDEKGKVYFDLGYNVSHGRNLDLFEAMLNKLQEITGSRNLAVQFFNKIRLKLVPIPSVLLEIIVNFFLDRPFSLNAADASELKTKYRKAIEADHKILAISHSQGGFYVNDAYHEVFSILPDWQRKTFTALHIGTPIGEIPSLGIHKTYNQDLIQLVRWLTGFSALPSNIPKIEHDASVHGPHPELEERLHHSLIETYMKIPEIRHSVTQAMRETLELLGPNCKGCYRGDEFQRGGYHRNSDDTTGGFVSITAKVDESVRITDNAEVCDEAQIRENASLSGDTRIENAAIVSGSAKIQDTARISDIARVYGNALITNQSKVQGAAQVYGNAVVLDQSVVEDSAQVFDNANIFDSARIFEKAQVYGTTFIGSSTQIGGVTAFFGSTGPTPMASLSGAFAAHPTLPSPKMTGKSVIKDSLIFGNTTIIGAGAVIEHVITFNALHPVSITGVPVIRYAAIGPYVSISGAATVQHSDLQGGVETAGSVSILDNASVFGSEIIGIDLVRISGNAQISASGIYQGNWNLTDSMISKACSQFEIGDTGNYRFDCLPFGHPDNHIEGFTLQFPPN